MTEIEQALFEFLPIMGGIAILMTIAWGISEFIKIKKQNRSNKEQNESDPKTDI
jgi:hypothetical protein